MDALANATELISAEEYNLLLGAKPATPELTPIKFSERKQILERVLAEQIEYRYINGACEDRAHYIALFLRKMGVDCGKIWNFAPARYSFISNELFTIEDPFGITDKITWGYHVAPFLKAYNKAGEIETIIIDQSFSPNSFLLLDEWLEKMKCPRAIYLLTDIDSYLFNSLEGFMGFAEHAHPNDSMNSPAIFPSIITGNFWTLFPDDDFVQKGLSINDLAIKIFDEKNQLPKEEEFFLDTLLKNIDDLISLTTSSKPDALQIDTYQQFKDFYEMRCEHWGSRLGRLN